MIKLGANSYELNAVHIIDPYKVKSYEAIVKIHLLNKICPFFIIGSTDTDFNVEYIKNYISEIRKYTTVKIVLSFPPSVKSGTYIFKNIGEDSYFHASLRTSNLAKFREVRNRLPENALGVFGYTFCEDSKTFDIVNVLPAPEKNYEFWENEIEVFNKSRYHGMYLYSRNEVVPESIIKYVKKNINKNKFLFVSGGYGTRLKQHTLRDSKVDYVVFGSILESMNWRNFIERLEYTK